jgi:hypothetical protein
MAHFEQNLETLEARLGAPRLGTVPYLGVARVQSSFPRKVVTPECSYRGRESRPELSKGKLDPRLRGDDMITDSPERPDDAAVARLLDVETLLEAIAPA